MQSVLSLMRALEYTERNLFSPITLQDVACAAYVSLPHLHRMFGRVFGCSLKEYIVKRRLCKAAHALLSGDVTVTALAFDCQFSSVESFSRAFKRQFLLTPTRFRREARFTELYPMYQIKAASGKGVFDMSKHITRGYDLTELSERLLDAKGTYILCVDVDNLMKINDAMGHGAGDIAIAETASRIERSITPDACFFRIGGDEFIVVTGSRLKDDAVAIAKRMLAYADTQLEYNGAPFSFSISVGVARVPDDLNSAEAAIEKAQDAMIAAKRERNAYATD